MPQEEIEFEKTPLHEAAEGGHVAAVEKLLAAGADTEAKDEVCGRGGGPGREQGKSEEHRAQFPVPSRICVAFFSQG